MAAQLSPDMLQQLFTLRDALNAAQHGEQTAQVEAFANRIGKSVNTVWVWLKSHAGYQSGRKRRADAGKTGISVDAIETIAAMKREGVRGNGKKTMPTCVAMNIAHVNGIEVNLSKSRINTIMREQRLDVASVVGARNTIQLRTEHPNHMHQIDPSLCLIYYMGGKQHAMRAEEFYKNKLENFAKVVLKVWRYVRYDHASGSVDVRYFEAAGENQHSLFEFLLWTWCKQANRLSHGVPKMLLWDKGSANTSNAIKSLLDALGVDHQTHQAGHAWAKGGVEQANNLVETHFESRLKIEPVDSVAQLNASAEKWVRDHNANAIPHVECRVKRASGELLVRDDLWQLIMRTPGALVEMPERKVCAWFLHGAEQSRQVRNLRISFVHPELGKSHQYDLRPWAEFLGNGVAIKVWPLLLKDGAVRIEIARIGGEPIIAEVGAEREFDEFGRSINAQMVGEYSRSSTTSDEAAEKRLAQAAYGADANRDTAEKSRATQARPFAHLNDGKGLVAHSHLGKEELPQRMLPKAQPLDTEQVRAARDARTEFPPLSLVEFAKSMGQQWQASFAAVVSQRYPEGKIPAADVESLKERLLRGEQKPLAVVGGMK
ncbi:MAG: integrase rve superfamily [Gallionellaceae bacterium]|nr:MAG: integrase rve superfamily [Gallionellaceae bacterium]